MKVELLRTTICAAILIFSSNQSQAAFISDGGFDNNPALAALTATNTPPTGIWLREGSGSSGALIVPAVGGVTPFLTDSPSATARMLQLNQLGGVATQVQQYVPFVGSAGDTVNFSAMFNDIEAGAIGSISIFALTGATPTFTPGPFQSIGNSLTLDGDENTWETLSVNLTLSGATTFLGIQVAYNNASLGSGGSAYVDSASLSAVPVPATAWLLASGLAGFISFAQRKKL